MASLLEGTLIMRYFLTFLSFGILLLGGVPSLLYAQNMAAAAAARQTVDSYARVEFNGGNPDEREKIIQFSPKRKAQIEDHKSPYARSTSRCHRPAAC